MNNKPNIVIGIDPGYAIIGWAVIDKTNRESKVMDYGIIETSKNLDFPERLKKIFQELTSIIKKYKPAIAGIEQLYFSKNTTTAIHVGHARGVIVLALKQHNCFIKEYTPLQIKQATASYGRADKKQMQKMMQTILKLPKPPEPDDAADALAIAWMCSEDLNNKLQ